MNTVEKYKKCLKLKPENISFLEKYGKAYFKLKYYKESAEKYEEYLKLKPNNTLVLKKCGNAYFKLEYYKKSVEKYEEYLKIESKDPFVLKKCGDAYYLSNQFESAIDKYEEYLKLKPEDAFLLEKSAEIYFKLGNIKSSAEKYKESAEAYNKIFNHSKAAEKYEEYLKLKPEDTFILKKCGDAYYFSNHFENAIDKYEECLKIESKDPFVLKICGDAYFNLEYYKKSVEKYEEYLKLQPDDAFVLKKCGDAYYLSNQFESAIDKYEEYLKLKPEDAFLLEKSAEIYFKLGNIKSSAEKYKESAEAYNKIFNHSKAAEKYEEYLKLKPEDISILEKCGEAYYLSNQFESAAEKYEKYLKLKPEDISILEKCGEAYYLSNQFESAAEKYEEYLKLKPENLSILKKCGDAYYRSNQFESAIKKYKEYLKLQPENLSILKKCGDAYYRSNQFEIAIDKYEEYLKLKPKDETSIFLLMVINKGRELYIYDSLCSFLYSKKDYEFNIHIQKTITNQKLDDSLKLLFAKTYLAYRKERNYLQESYKILQDLVLNSNGAEASLYYSNICFLLGNLKEAEKYYNQLIEQKIFISEAYCGLGRISHKDNKQAESFFDNSLKYDPENYISILNKSILYSQKQEQVGLAKELFIQAIESIHSSLEKQAVLSFKELLYIAEKSIDYQENYKQADYYIGYIINSNFEEIDYYSIVRIYEKIYKKVTDPTEKKNYKEKYTDTFKKAFEVEANIEKFAESHLEKIEQLIQLDLEQIKKEAEHRDTLEREVEKEKSRVFQQLAHTLKNITSSVKDSLNILFEEEALKDYQDEIAPAIRGVNLITDYITSINQSFHIVPEDMQYDVINSVDGSKYIVIQDILLESIQYAISNMFDYKYFGKYQKKFFPTKNDSITARKEWEKIYKNLNWENLSLFLKEHFFNFALLDYSKSCLKIGNIKDSKNKLLTLFQEIFLNAFKYSSPVEKEKRVVAITIEESEDCIQLSIENTFNLTSSYKNTGVGLLIIKNYQPIYRKPPSIEREGDKYRITVYITNYWKEVLGL